MYSATRASVGPALSMLQMVSARSMSSCRSTRLAASSASDILCSFIPRAPSYISPVAGKRREGKCAKDVHKSTILNFVPFVLLSCCFLFGVGSAAVVRGASAACLFIRPGGLSVVENTSAFGNSLGRRRGLAEQGFLIESLYHTALD